MAGVHFWLGKDHNVPETDLSAGANKSQWPLQQGYDRFYGFIGGETNQFYPDLTEDNHPIEQPYGPEEGYHLSKDLADQAIKMISDQKSANPSQSPGICGIAPVLIMHHTRHLRIILQVQGEI